jgi:hypothetical protein
MEPSLKHALRINMTYLAAYTDQLSGEMER